jgi:hypothetical protein
MTHAKLGVMSRIWRFILWDFPRASVPYDIMVAVILLFIFLSPRELFHDQPKPASVVMIQAEHGDNAYWIEPELLSGVPENDRLDRANALVKSRFHGRQRIVRVEPILDAEQEVRGYVAFPGQ